MIPRRRLLASLLALAACALAACTSVPTGEQLELADGHVYFESEGRGPALFLVHGSAHHGIFSPLRGQLTDVATVVALDRRGYGRSRFTTSTLPSNAGDVADLEALRVHLGFDRIDVLGLSAGGPIAIDYALTHPERVRRLILLSTYADDMTRTTQAWELVQQVLADPEHRRQVAAIKARDLPGEQKRVELFLVTPHPLHELPVPRATVEAWFRTGVLESGTNPPHRDYANLDALAGLRMPTLVINGRYDRVTPLAHARAMARQLPAGELVVLPRSGHLAFVEERDRFVTELRRFLSR